MSVDLSVQLPGVSFIEGSTIDATVGATAERDVTVEGGRVKHRRISRLGSAPDGVGASRRVVTQPGQHDGRQGAVELAITAAVMVEESYRQAQGRYGSM